MEMNKEQEKVWDRLKHGVRPPRPSPEELQIAFMRGARSMGKTTMALQAFGRALRDIKDEVVRGVEED